MGGVPEAAKDLCVPVVPALIRGRFLDSDLAATVSESWKENILQNCCPVVRCPKHQATNNLESSDYSFVDLKDLIA